MPNILLVDDDPGIIEVHGEFLRRAGHEVTTARNGREAIRVVQSGTFDLMITDIVMPDKEGLETILEIRRIRPGIKVIAMSGGGRVSAREYLHIAQKFGAVQTLAKPFSGQELTFAIAQALGL